jgi:DNA polymerase III subunit delta'
LFFKDIIGQEAVKNQLLRTAFEGRIAHAQIFLGNEGTGNLALAFAYAKYVLCSQKTETDACGTCSNCTKAEKLIHPDLHFSYPTVGAKALSTEYLPQWRKAIQKNAYLNVQEWIAHLDGENKQGNITAAECLDISKKLSLKSFEADYKILILWLPEYLGKEGNRLLKLIEEPPEKTLFLLVAQQQDLILNTILSRCQLIKTNPLSDEEIQMALVKRQYLPPDTAFQIACLADGNYNEALLLVGNPTNNLTPDFLHWFRVAYKGDPNEMVPWAEEFAKKGREPMKHFMRYVLFFLREYAMVLMTGAPSARFKNEENEAAKKMTAVITLDAISAMSKLIDDSLFAVERNANAKILFLDKTVKLHNILRGK